MVSFDEIKDGCVPTATDPNGKQITMYVHMLSITNLLVLPLGLFLGECDFFLNVFSKFWICFETKNLQL